MKKTSFFIYVLFCLLLVGCATNKSPDIKRSYKIDMKKIHTCKQISNKKLGILLPTIGSPTAKFIYKPEGIQSIVASYVQQSNCFKLSDWRSIQEVIEQNQLKSTAGNTANEEQNLAKSLLVDYFLVIVINTYNDKIRYPENSTINKTKIRTVEVGVQMFLKDAINNDILYSTESVAKTSEKLENTLGFGASSNIGGDLPNSALKEAVIQCINSLFSKL